MRNKLTLPILAFTVLIGLAIYVILSNQDNNSKKITNNDNDKRIIFYSSANCPFCIMVEDYLRENNITEKVTFIKKQVDNNQENSNDLLNKATACGLSTNEIGVPFLWTGSECLIGGPDIIDFFEAKAQSSEIDTAKIEAIINEENNNK